jgi:hypothetical protein
MATVNVYVPDALKARLEKANLNLSSFAQEAWEAALVRAELPEGKFALDVLDKDGDPIELQFTGVLIATSRHGAVEMYLTTGDEVVFVDEDGSFTAGPVSDWDCDGLWSALGDKDAVADACAALGIKNVVRL